MNHGLTCRTGDGPVIKPRPHHSSPPPHTSLCCSFTFSLSLSLSVTFLSICPHPLSFFFGFHLSNHLYPSLSRLLAPSLRYYFCTNMRFVGFIEINNSLDAAAPGTEASITDRRFILMSNQPLRSHLDERSVFNLHSCLREVLNFTFLGDFVASSQVFLLNFLFFCVCVCCF